MYICCSTRWNIHALDWICSHALEDNAGSEPFGTLDYDDGISSSGSTF